MIDDEINELTKDIKTLEQKVERLKRIRGYLRKLKKLNEIDIRLGIDKRRAAMLHDDERRARAKR